MKNSLLERLAIIYGPPESPDPQAYMAEVAALIDGYSEQVLKAAGDAIIREYRGRGFPRPAEIVTACREACERQPFTPTEQRQWGPSRRRPNTPEEDERYRKAAEWQKQVCDQYGSMDAYLKATVHLRDDGYQGGRPARRRSSFASLSSISKRITGDRAE